MNARLVSVPARDRSTGHEKTTEGNTGDCFRIERVTLTSPLGHDPVFPCGATLFGLKHGAMRPRMDGWWKHSQWPSTQVVLDSPFSWAG